MIQWTMQHKGMNGIFVDFISVQTVEIVPDRVNEALYNFG